MSKRVYLAVGHGIKPDGTVDPGAVSTDGTWTEQKAGDVIVAEVAEYLRNAGVVVVDEAYQKDPNFVGTTDRVNKGNYDLAVTVHHDWNKAPSGGFGFWYPGSVRGQDAADAILDAYKRLDLPTRDEWHKGRGNLYFLRNTKCPAVLWECGRIGEYSDDELLLVAQAIVEGIAEYLDVTLGVETKPAPSTAQTAEEALAEIKDHLGIKVGQRWNVEDFQVISDRVRHLT